MKTNSKIIIILVLLAACCLSVNSAYAKKATLKGTFKMFKGQEGVLRYSADTSVKVKWKIANKKIGKLKTMDNKAYITAKKNGSTLIYATVGGKKYSYKMNVVKTKKTYLNTTAVNVYKNKKYTIKIFNAKVKITRLLSGQHITESIIILI